MALASPVVTKEPTSPAARQEMLPIYSVTPFTMLDFPGKTSCIIWISGCNMRCAYCHNPQIIKSIGRKDQEDVLAFLKKRQGLLEGVVVSGGEATLYPGLASFIQKIKNMGYAVKLDTNGLRPETVRTFIENRTLDYLALDYKAPPEKFKLVTGVEKYALFSRTLDLLCGQDVIPFEVRTTVHTQLLQEEDVSAIIRDLDDRGYQGTYYVQNYQAEGGCGILKNLGAQKRLLQCDQLAEPTGFDVAFRNF